MRNCLKIFMLPLLLLLGGSLLALEKQQAESFVVSIGNQAIKILKIPVDDKTKRKTELRNLLKEKFDMKFISKVILGKEISKNMSQKKLDTFADIFEVHIVNVYSSQLGTYKGQKFTVKNCKLRSSK